MIEFIWDWLLGIHSQLSENFGYQDLFDIALVAFAIYWLLILIRGTRAVQILMGLMIMISTGLLSERLQLRATDWIIDTFLGSAVIILVILFQQDIRRALARVGRGVFRGVTHGEESQILEEVVRATQILGQKRVGALIVLERETQLLDLIEAGVSLDAAVSHELLVSLFLPYSPLHDGAVVIQDGRISQAGCILPLTLRSDLPDGLGTRHRAAVGITEETDAVVIVVSEETATLSVVYSGELLRDLDGPRLRESLRDIMALPAGAPLEAAKGEAGDVEARIETPLPNANQAAKS